MVGCSILVNKKTDWLRTLLHSDFFGSCVDHPELRKNEKNVFCIDCSLGFCRHCTATHRFHSRLQICKYVYHDVVRLQDMQKYLDCSKIQTYKINGEKAVHLNPRPQCKETKPSTKSKFAAACEACGRYIQDLPNRFCSIACKVSVVPVNPKDQKHKMLFSIEEFPDLSWKESNSNPEDSRGEKESRNENKSSLSSPYLSEESEAGWMSSALKPKKQIHKRKGLPRRAPLC